MTLAGMRAADETALICDLAETYGVLRYWELPPVLAAALASGLREDARIRRKLSGTRAGLETLLLAAAVDRLSWLVWARSKEGAAGRGRPESLAALLTRPAEPKIMGYNTPEEFEAARAAIIKEVEGHGG